MSGLPLQGRRAIVTGGAVRLGRAIAIRLASAGASVCVHYSHSSDAAREVVTELSTLGVSSLAVAADFSASPHEAAGDVIQAAGHALGPIDLLVNSAAIFESASLEETTPESWQRHFAINLEAPVWLMQAFAAQLPKDKAGDIINIVDWRGLRPVPGHFSYTLSKSALVAATRLLAVELGPRIKVNAIAPGAILPAPGTSESEFQQLADHIPLQRVGSPDDVTDAMMSLLQSRFITGEVLSVTGGQQL